MPILPTTHNVTSVVRDNQSFFEEDPFPIQTIHLYEDIHNLRNILIEADILLTTCQSKIRDNATSRPGSNNYISATRSILKSQIARCDALLMNLPHHQNSQDQPPGLH